MLFSKKWFVPAISKMSHRRPRRMTSKNPRFGSNSANSVRLKFNVIFLEIFLEFFQSDDEIQRGYILNSFLTDHQILMSTIIELLSSDQVSH